ncbi:MAG: hypothetical protein PHU14_12525 [Methylovulum sp.]|nr:hypothetical protein [Methylovulum sp.]
MEKEELLMLSRIVIVEHDRPELEELNRFSFATSSNPIEAREARNENLLGQDIKQAFFIPLKQAA